MVTDIKTISKTILPYLLLVFLIVLVGNSFMNFLKRVFPVSELMGLTKDDKSKISDETVITEKLKYSDSYYRNIADGLYKAMYNYGTDERSIFGLLDELSNLEYLKVYQLFGKRAYDPVLGTATLLPFLNKNYDLNNWLHSELGKKDYQKIKAMFLNSGTVWP